MTATAPTPISEPLVTALTCPIDAIAALPSSTELLVQSEGEVYAVREAALAAATGRRPLDVTDKQAARRVAAALTGTPLVDYAGQTLVYPHRTRVAQFRLTDPAIRKPAALFNYDKPLERCLPSGDGRWLLCVTLDTQDPDFASHELMLADLKNNRTNAVEGIRSTHPLQIGWSTTGAYFLAFDTCSESLWIIDPKAPAPAKAPREHSGRSTTGLLVHPDGGFAALVESNGSTFASHGRLGGDGVNWEGLTTLPEGLIRCLAWRPGQRELAYVRNVRRRAFLEVINLVGAVTHSRELPRAWFADQLTWSGDGTAVYFLTQRGIGIWKLQ